MRAAPQLVNRACRMRLPQASFWGLFLARVPAMSARFVGVLSRQKRAKGLASLGVVAALSCSVFPDQATLPKHVVAGSGGSAGGPSAPQAGMGGNPVGGLAQAGTGVGAAVAAGAGGASALGGAPGTLAGAAGEAAGAGGAAPLPCVSPEQEVVLAPTADTWIEAARPSTGHGTDVLLSVLGGSDERRALLQITLPAAPAGKQLSRARLVLELQQNADVTLAARSLGLEELGQAVSETQTTWLNYDKGGSHRWMLAGGDVVAELATATLRAGTASGALTFEVTVPIRKIVGAAAIPLSLIVIEKGPTPAAPAELAFASREGDALGVPTLILDYCDP